MSESSNKRLKRCKLESRTSKKAVPSKRRRRMPLKRRSKQTEDTPEPDAIPSTSAEPLVQFSIQIEVESCDEDWWYEEESRRDEPEDCKDWNLENAREETNADSKQLLSYQNASNNEESSPDSVEKKIETEKSNKLKFAYLEALNQNSVIEKLEESSYQLRRQSVTELENLKSLRNGICDETFEDICIKNEVPDEYEELNDQDPSENLTEYLGITIKEEPLPESIDKDSELTDTNQLCLKVDSVQSNVCWDVNDVDNNNEEEAPDESLGYNDIQEKIVNTSLSVSQKKSNRDDMYDIYLTSQDKYVPPSWHLHSRFFDLALNNALESSSHMAQKQFRFQCGLCGQTFPSLIIESRAIDACVEYIRSHLNYNHLYDTLLVEVVHPTNDGEPCTILTKKVSSSDEKYVGLLTAARIDLQITEKFLQSIANCITRGRPKHVCQILSYKCYQCKICYEYVGHYLEHLKTTHAVRDTKFISEGVRKTFLNVTAFKSTKQYEDFPVIVDESNKPIFKCLLCKVDFGNDEAAYVEHRNMKLKCSGCKRSCYCSQIHAHIGKCTTFFQKIYPKTCPCKKIYHDVKTLDKHQKTCQYGDTTLAFNCLVCSFMATTKDMLEDHQRYAHTVRSDQFIFSDDFFKQKKTERVLQARARKRMRHELSVDRLIREIKGSKCNTKQYYQAKQQAHPTGFNANSPTTTKSKRKVLKIKQKPLASTLSAPCPICPFRRTDETLENHMVTYHLVRSDIRILPAVHNCRCHSVSLSCTETYSSKSAKAMLLKRTQKNHSENHSELYCSVCNVGNICPICQEICGEGFLDSHLRDNHQVRSDVPIRLDTTRCDLCETTYPGPVLSHDCPKKLDLVRCFYCHRIFRNDHFLVRHLKGQNSVLCTNCNQVLEKRCMKLHHDMICRGDYTLVHECLNCGYKEDEVSAINAHCRDCFPPTEPCYKTFQYKELIVPRVSMSTDSKNDHSYAKEPIPSVADESTGLTTQNSDDSLMSNSNILCTEVYEDTELEYAATKAINDDLDVVIPKVTILQPLADSDATKNVTDNSQNDGEESSKVDDLEKTVPASSNPHSFDGVGIGTKSFTDTDDVSEVFKSSKVFTQTFSNKSDLVKQLLQHKEAFIVTGESSKEESDRVEEVPAVVKIKSEPVDEEEFVVTKTTEIDADLSIEEFIANNSEIVDREPAEIEPKVIITTADAIHKRKRQSKKIYICKNCGYKGPHRDFKEHLKTCKPRPKTRINLISLPYNCLDYCESFKCYVCATEQPTLDDYLTHKCKRKGSCPCCKSTYKNLSHFKGHLQNVIRKHYSDIPEDASGKCFNCVECRQPVATADLFNHWAEHTLGDATLLKAEKNRVKIEQDYDSVRETTADTSQHFRDLQLKTELEFHVPTPNNQDAPLEQEVLNDLLTTLQTSLKGARHQGVCKLCVKVFARNREFKIHLVEHLLRDAYSKKKVRGALRCQICSQDHEKAPDYKMHMRNHADLPLYQCPKCDKTFSDCSNLAKHRKVHNMEVKLCDICNKKFNCKIMLARHLKLHATLTPLQCPHCPESFLFPSEFRRHLKSRHRTEPQIQSCTVCKAKLGSMKLKWDHEWHVHGVRKISADCPVCGEQFRRYIDLKKHIRNHSELIEYSESDLRLHSLLGALDKYDVQADDVHRIIEKEIGGASKSSGQVVESEKGVGQMVKREEGAGQAVKIEMESFDRIVKEESFGHIKQKGFGRTVKKEKSLDSIVKIEMGVGRTLKEEEGLRKNVSKRRRKV